MSAFPPPGQRTPTKLPGAPSAAVLAGREIFERAWVFSVSIDSPDEVTLDDAGRKVASLVRELLQAQMESYCAAVCNHCAPMPDTALVWVRPAWLDTYRMEWRHEWGIIGSCESQRTILCGASKIRETWRKGIWADGIE